jgi:hypothetical protein
MFNALRLAFVALAFIALGCGSSSSNSAVQTEQANGQCPMMLSVLTGVAINEDTCSSWSDCAATCCMCPESTKTWAAAACIEGRCDQPAACAQSSNPAKFCN